MSDNHDGHIVVAGLYSLPPHKVPVILFSNSIIDSRLAA